MSGRFSLASEGSVPAGRPCPILTERAVSLQEACGITVPEIRAYKLGKKRWSYNQVEVVLMEAGGTKQLHVQQASSMAAQDDGEVSNGPADHLIRDQLLVTHCTALDLI